MSTHRPASRTEMKEYCLRQLGKPVIDINVVDDQVEDCVEAALKYYADYHFDGAEKQYLKHEITQDDIDNKWIPISNNVVGVNGVFDIGFGGSSSGGLFNVQYQMVMSDMQHFASMDLVSMVMTQQHLEVVNQLINGKPAIRYNRHANKMHIDIDWSKIGLGSYIIIECYTATDPEVYSDVWNDRWLLKYTTALIKKQWGSNLIKFEGMQLPGGVTFSGMEIFNQANEDITQLEDEMINSFSLPVFDISG